MSQSLSNLIVHIVFCPKHKQPFLRDEIIRDEMHRQLGGQSKTLECPPLLVGGVEDHIHILARQGRTICVADWVKELKRVTSLWIKESDPQLHDFQWQAGYGAFSVSQSNADRVITYIKDQKEHHQRYDFKTEYQGLLERH